MANIKEKLSLLPDKPGCYLMKDKDGIVIYVGKAKILKNRVRSYFSGSHDGKTERLISEIVDFEYIVTSSATEALILENNLIKKYHPRYNVLLKDDKTYPYLKITNELHPRIEITRKVEKDKAKYFGPYPDVGAIKQTKKILDRIYPLRKCKTMKDEVCLYYHIGQCMAPCVNKIETDIYKEMIQGITRFLQGDYQFVKEDLSHKMLIAAENLEFERAKELRDQIRDIEAIMEKQKIAINDHLDRDIFGYYADKGSMCVQILYIRQGNLIERKVSIFPFYGDEKEEFLSYLTQYYFANPLLPKEIILPEDLSHEWLEDWLKIKVFVPKRGLKKQLVEMATENAKLALTEHLQIISKNYERTTKAMQNLANLLNLSQLHVIEAFDNSNIQGTDPVAAMVVFVNGKPEKKEYRKFRIKSVEGADDYKSMAEVIRRRYSRILKEGKQLPDLIIVDGGKGQMKVATEVLQDELNLDLPVAGLVKDDKHKTSQLLFGDPPHIVEIKRDSEEFYLLQRIQDEVHRFAISFHRQIRSKGSYTSILDEIPNIGDKRKKILLKHFGSLKKIKEANIEEFRQIGIGDKLAKEIISFLQQKS